jgi:hypothetical protein
MQIQVMFMKEGSRIVPVDKVRVVKVKRSDEPEKVLLECDEADTLWVQHGGEDDWTQVQFVRQKKRP